VFRMNCRSYRPTLIEFARGVPLPAIEEQRLSDHLALCPGCSEVLSEQSRLNAAIESLNGATKAAAAEVWAPISASIEQRVLADLDALRPQTGLREFNNAANLAGRSERQWSRRRLAILTAAIAACLLVVASAAFYTRSQRHLQDPQPYAASALKRAEPQSASEPLPARESTAAVRSAAARGGTRKLNAAPQRIFRATDLPINRAAAALTPGSSSAASPHAGEANQPFIVIPYTEPLAPYERASIMRMDLPITAVMAAGLPIGAQDPAERVRADVVVGEDGRARAIRLLYVENSDSGSVAFK